MHDHVKAQELCSICAKGCYEALVREGRTPIPDPVDDLYDLDQEIRIRWFYTTEAPGWNTPRWAPIREAHWSNLIRDEGRYFGTVWDNPINPSYAIAPTIPSMIGLFDGWLLKKSNRVASYADGLQHRGTWAASEKPLVGTTMSEWLVHVKDIHDNLRWYPEPGPKV